MKKNTITKLAVMVILGGSLVSGVNASEIAVNNNSQQGAMTLLAAGCGAHSCSGTPSSSGNGQKSSYTADREVAKCGGASANSGRPSYSANRDAVYNSLADASQDSSSPGTSDSQDNSQDNSKDNSSSK